MKKNKFSGTRKKDIKFTACTGLISVSKICFFSKIMQNKPVSKIKNPSFAENKTPEAKTYQKEKYDNVIRKTPKFSLPTLIRIRATDREGNTIEVTY
jgi:hypothetical protein